MTTESSTRVPSARWAAAAIATAAFPTERRTRRRGTKTNSRRPGSETERMTTAFPRRESASTTSRPGSTAETAAR